MFAGAARIDRVNQEKSRSDPEWKNFEFRTKFVKLLRFCAVEILKNSDHRTDSCFIYLLFRHRIAYIIFAAFSNLES